MLRTDLAARGVPWVALLQVRGGTGAGALNLGWPHRLAAGAAVVALVARRRRGRVATAALAAMIAPNVRFYARLHRLGGPRLALAAWRCTSSTISPRWPRCPPASAVGARGAAMPPAPPSLRLGLVGCGRLAERGYAPASRTADGRDRRGRRSRPHAARARRRQLGASGHARVSEMLAATPCTGSSSARRPPSTRRRRRSPRGRRRRARREAAGARWRRGARLAALAPAVGRLQPPLRPGPRARAPGPAGGELALELDLHYRRDLAPGARATTRC